MPKKSQGENKSARFGMRVAPSTKDMWTATAHAWGYKSVSEWLEAMANWAICFDQFDGSYEKYQEALKNGKLS